MVSVKEIMDCVYSSQMMDSGPIESIIVNPSVYYRLANEFKEKTVVYPSSIPEMMVDCFFGIHLEVSNLVPEDKVFVRTSEGITESKPEHYNCRCSFDLPKKKPKRTGRWIRLE